MKQSPILSNKNEFADILSGSKTMLRRVVKWPDVPEWHEWDYDPNIMIKPQGGEWWPHFVHRGFNGKKDIDLTGPIKCPYGKVGDWIYVRPSIRTNKSAAFIWLQITDVKVEQYVHCDYGRKTWNTGKRITQARGLHR